MKKILLVLMVIPCLIFAQNLTPQTISMDAAVSNATAFGTSGLLGSDGTTKFYVHWDATYIYFGWDGGNTYWDASDLYYVAIDTDPEGTNGTNNPIEGVSFKAGGPRPDHYIVYENNVTFYGAGNGNGYERYNVVSGSWSYVEGSRISGNDNVNSKIIFGIGSAEVRLKVAWSDINFTPGSTAKIGIVMWCNNGSGNYMWGRYPTEGNPVNGSTPKTLETQLKFSSTGNGVNPSTAGNPIAFPVELSSFTAAIQNKAVVLNWVTATEINNYGFEVEKSFDKVNWNKIAFKNGYGNSNSVKDYTYTDNEITKNGIYYYRLKQIDNNGDFEYSNIVEVNVNIPIKFEVSQNYPNPFNPVTNISFNLPEANNVTLYIFNAIGQQIKTINAGYKEAGKHTIEFDGSSLNSGVYFYKVEAGNNSMIRKMALIK